MHFFNIVWWCCINERQREMAVCEFLSYILFQLPPALFFSFLDCRLSTPTLSTLSSDKNISPLLVYTPRFISATMFRDLTSQGPSCDPPTERFARKGWGLPVTHTPPLCNPLKVDWTLIGNEGNDLVTSGFFPAKTKTQKHAVKRAHGT